MYEEKHAKLCWLQSEFVFMHPQLVLMNKLHHLQKTRNLSNPSLTSKVFENSPKKSSIIFPFKTTLNVCLLQNKFKYVDNVVEFKDLRWNVTCDTNKCSLLWLEKLANNPWKANEWRSSLSWEEQWSAWLPPLEWEGGMRKPAETRGQKWQAIHLP